MGAKLLLAALELRQLSGTEAVVMLPAIGTLGVALKEAEHLPTIGDAEVNLADGARSSGCALGAHRR